MRTTAIHVVCALFIASVAQHTNAQSIQQWIGWGDAAMDKGEYYGASRFYAGALQLEPGRMLLQWKQAEACRLSHQYDRAADLYDRVYRKDMGRTYPLALRWAGEMQLCDARYAEARITWSKVLQKEKNKDSVIAQRARHALAGCALADTAMSDTLALSHLPGPVNTFDSEFGARPGPDSTLWFSSLRGELNDEQEVVDTANYRIGIYHATRNVGTWNDPVYDPIAGGQGAQQAKAKWCPLQAPATDTGIRSRPWHDGTTAMSSSSPAIEVVDPAAWTSGSPTLWATPSRTSGMPGRQ
jgi:tetratricopeptide (TPR) repeat protein